MNTDQSRFNLLDEPWIPVLLSTGENKRMGILETFAEAHRIREIAAGNPMDRVAILRFLLALLYWCRGNPDQAARPGSDEAFAAAWFDRLRENRECFDLFGDEPRFYQYREPSEVPDMTANYLIHEIPTGTNKVHFRHSTDKRDGLCAACCAKGLLRLPVFTTSGGSGKSPGINSKPPVYAFPVGPTLGATLALLWRPIAPSALGEPAWLKPQQPLPDVGPVPHLVGLTWLPRRVWLSDPSNPPDRCASCGTSGRLVRTCVFKGVGSTKQEGRAQREWADPHILRAPNNRGDVVPYHARDPIATNDAGVRQRFLHFSATRPESWRSRRTDVRLTFSCRAIWAWLTPLSWSSRMRSW